MKLKLYKDGYINTSQIVSINVFPQPDGNWIICCHMCGGKNYTLEDSIPTNEQAWAKLHEIKRNLEIYHE